MGSEPGALATTEIVVFEDVKAPARFRTVRQVLKKKVAIIALAYLLVFYAGGLLAPVIAPYGLQLLHVNSGTDHNRVHGVATGNLLAAN